MRRRVIHRPSLTRGDVSGVLAGSARLRKAAPLGHLTPAQLATVAGCSIAHIKHWICERTELAQDYQTRVRAAFPNLGS